MNPESETIRVWLIEDNRLFRQSLAAAIESEPGFLCCGAFSSCEEAIEAAKTKKPPDLVLLDIALPGMSGLEGLPALQTALPGAKCVILTVFEDTDKIIRAISSGAAGFLLKTAGIQEIAASLRDIRNGGAPMNPRIAGKVLELFHRLRPTPPDFGLTDRERTVLVHIVNGLTKKEIASQMNISVHTADAHLRSIYTKLHVNNRAGAVSKALREGLL